MQEPKESVDLLWHLEHDPFPDAPRSFFTRDEKLVAVRLADIQAIAEDLEAALAKLAGKQKALQRERYRRQCRDFILCFLGASVAGWYLLKAML